MSIYATSAVLSIRVVHNYGRLFYLEGQNRKSFQFVVISTYCEHGESGRCRLETPGIQSPIKKIRSDLLLCMTTHSLTCLNVFVLPLLVLDCLLNSKHGIQFVLPINLCTAATVQARKVRGVNVQHSGAILRASLQVSFFFISLQPWLTVHCALHEVNVEGLWKLAHCYSCIGSQSGTSKKVTPLLHLQTATGFYYHM